MDFPILQEKKFFETIYLKFFNNLMDFLQSPDIQVDRSYFILHSVMLAVELYFIKNFYC